MRQSSTPSCEESLAAARLLIRASQSGRALAIGTSIVTRDARYALAYWVFVDLALCLLARLALGRAIRRLLATADDETRRRVMSGIAEAAGSPLFAKERTLDALEREVHRAE